MEEVMRRVEEIARALSVLRLPAAPGEYDMHELVERALEQAELPVAHEVRLGPGRRIDFMCGGVGIEVKKGKPARAAVLSQLRRYALSGEVEALIVVAPGDLRLAARDRRGTGTVCSAGQAVGGGVALRRRSKSFKHAMQAREMYAARDEYIRQRYGDAEDSDAGAENIADEQPMQRLSTEPKSAECSPDAETGDPHGLAETCGAGTDASDALDECGKGHG